MAVWYSNLIDETPVTWVNDSYTTAFGNLDAYILDQLETEFGP
jgi:hypothetical protein